MALIIIHIARYYNHLMIIGNSKITIWGNMNVLLINASPKKDQASTHLIAQVMVNTLLDNAEVKLDTLDVTMLPHIDRHYAEVLCGSASPHTDSASLNLSDGLVASLEKADLLIITSPMHNYTLPSSLKCWLDYVVRAGKTFEITDTGKLPLLKDKPVYILISSGGSFSGELAYQPDFFTPYMKAILATIGLTKLHFFSIEGTAGDPEVVEQQIYKIQQQVCDHLRASI